MPHAVSTTLCLPVLMATAKATAITTSSAPPVMRSVTPNEPASSPLTARA